ncbi:5-formyltetrahydrofolate cyclo-ligase [Salibacterium sp. K-3]
MKQKKEIRLQIRNTFQQMPLSELEQQSRTIYHQLFQSCLWQNASTIAVTMSTKNEINTKPVIEQAWREGKITGIPKTEPLDKTLAFYHITSYEETKQAFAGIWEPDPTAAVLLQPGAFDLIIVPGMAFDREKYRIGFGGGYYDRFLQNIDAPACALLYSFQLFNWIPRESHDIPLDFLVTDTGIF